MKNEVMIQPKQQQPTTQIVLDQEKRSWWNSLTDKQRHAITSLAIVLGISVVAVIAIKFASNQVREAIANKEENNSFGSKDHATWAKQLKNAFDNDGWWGTDEVAVRQVLRAIPSQEDFQKVQTSYRKLYKGANLIEDMTSELKTSEFNEMLAIVQAKPQKAKDAGSPIYDPHGWAKRLYSALDYAWLGLFWGTDEDAVLAVFSEIPTQKAFNETAQVYANMYGTSLADDLDGDLDWTMDWREKIKKKPKS